jgi:hypothetical protein
MLPPSAMLGLAVRLTVVASVVSLMLVVAATVEAARLSKLPPVAPVMLRLTVLLSRYTSSPGAATLTVPLRGAAGDGDDAAAGDGHQHLALRRGAQARGVGDAAAFGDARAGREAHRGGVGGVADAGRRRHRGGREALEVAAGGAGDAAAHRAAVQIHVLAGRGDAHRAAGGCRWRW